jgi:hypothetical protein
VNDGGWMNRAHVIPRNLLGIRPDDNRPIESSSAREATSRAKTQITPASRKLK